MKAIIKEEKRFKKKILLTKTDDETWNEFTEVILVYENRLGYCMKLPFQCLARLTSVELRAIAKRIDEYNAQLKNLNP